jgi:arginyl-tRNA synthetase
MNLRTTLEVRLKEAFARCGAPADCPAVVSPSARAEFGDYQASGAMGAAKRLKTNPRQLAQKIAEAFEQDPEVMRLGIVAKIEIAGPGFINIFLKGEFIQAELGAISANRRGGSDRLGAEKLAKPQAVVVDYSSPNLAKEMHVGHLRSTIIGDAIARALEFLGHKVIRQNHVGDWGTKIGMLTAFLDDIDSADKARTDVITGVAHINDLEEFYRQANLRFGSDPRFADKAREFVVRLQSGTDEHVRDEWRRFVNLSWYHCAEVYKRLGVGLTAHDARGESAYNGDLPNVIEHLRAVLPKDFRESQGALCVFLDEFKGKDDEPLPFIVQKSDEGYLYATTDLAAIWFRCGKGRKDGVVDWVADRILYVVDARQSLHFKMLFAVARKAGFAPESVSLEHIPFGTVMGPDGKPFKTRDGGTVKLMDLLEEAVKKAKELVERKNADDVAAGRAQPLSEEVKKQIAETVGIGAVKYADLSQNRTSDYVFSWEKMLSLVGNTAPYMQYAYARIHSIVEKSAGSASASGVPPICSTAVPAVCTTGVSPVSSSSSSAAASVFLLSHPAERALAVKLLQFPETVQAVGEECLPNILCSYLYDLAGLFMGFYENCPVLQSAEPLRSSRLAMCDLTGRVIQKGLELLGIGTIERM